MSACARCAPSRSTTLIAEHGVTHLCGAPIVMQCCSTRARTRRSRCRIRCSFFTAAAPPPAAVLDGMSEAGFDVTHVYGLTETYGPAVVNDWKDEWNALDADDAGASSRRGRACATMRSRR